MPERLLISNVPSEGSSELDETGKAEQVPEDILKLQKSLKGLLHKNLCPMVSRDA